MLSLTALLSVGCSDWIMNDEYGLSVRTMDLGSGPTFSLHTQPRGSKFRRLAPSKYGFLMSKGENFSAGASHSRLGLPASNASETAMAGINEAGLTCDLHVLLNTSYPKASGTAKDLEVSYFCNWALGAHGSAAEVKKALLQGQVHLWGPSDEFPIHFIVRDADGVGLAVEFIDGQMELHDDRNDGVEGYGVFTNEPPFPWHLANVRHYLWKQSLARPATAMPGAWYPDERFLRIYLTKRAMPAARSLQEAVQHALHVLNTITVPMGNQMGTDSGVGEGAADHTHYGHIYDHKNRVLYWRHQSNLQLERVRLADLDLHEGAKPVSLSLYNALPWYNDAAHAFA
jgi:penicillin V acylase-like amidase (Ntn superfamily)